MNKIHQQFSLEDEGAKFALNGGQRDNCPYKKETHPFEWNHWIFGYDNAIGELNIMKEGFVTFCSTADNWQLIPENKIPVRQAIESGLWKPRYITEKSS